MKTILFSTGAVIVFFIGAFIYMQNQDATDLLKSNSLENQDFLSTSSLDLIGQEATTTFQNTTGTEDAVKDLDNEEKQMIFATINTDKGVIEVELYPQVAPKTVENFVKLANDNFFDDIKFHRVIQGFMIQGGDPLSKTNDPRTGTGGPGYNFEDEINPRSLGLAESRISELEASGYVYNYELQSMKMDVSVIAMANSGPNTNGSQFFIVTDSAQPHLDGLHTVFGKVKTGMDIVRSIKQNDVINSVTIIEQ